MQTHVVDFIVRTSMSNSSQTEQSPVVETNVELSVSVS